MTISEIKKEMKAFRDLYGGGLLDAPEIDAATTKEELADIIERHRWHMEAMLQDADSHIDRFKKRLGLLKYQPPKTNTP